MRSLGTSFKRFLGFLKILESLTWISRNNFYKHGTGLLAPLQRIGYEWLFPAWFLKITWQNLKSSLCAELVGGVASYAGLHVGLTISRRIMNHYWKTNYHFPSFIACKANCPTDMKYIKFWNIFITSVHFNVNCSFFSKTKKKDYYNALKFSSLQKSGVADC